MDEVENTGAALLNPVQTASRLMQAMFLAFNFSAEDQARQTVDVSQLHFHDSSQSQIAFNDVQAIRMKNQFFNLNLPVPLTASEAYNVHDHGPYTGGVLPTRTHDHRDNENGGFSFAVYHPGTSLPQQNWAI